MNSEVKTRVKTEGVNIKISNSISPDSSTMSLSIKCLMNSCEEKSEFSNMNPFLDHCVRLHFFDELKSDLKNTARHELECPLCPDDRNTFQKLKPLIWHYGVHHEMVLKYAKFQTISTETKKECKRKQQKQRLRKLIKEFQNEIIVLKEDCAKSELEKEKLLKKNEENEAKISKQNIELENYSSTRKKFICKKCCTDLESGYMLDCGHLPFCNSCSMSITIEESPKCPICKKSVAYRLPALIEEVI